MKTMRLVHSVGMFLFLLAGTAILALRFPVGGDVSHPLNQWFAAFGVGWSALCSVARYATWDIQIIVRTKP